MLVPLPAFPSVEESSIPALRPAGCTTIPTSASSWHEWQLVLRHGRHRALDHVFRCRRPRDAPRTSTELLVCQSTTQFYAQCPQRCLTATRPASQAAPPQRPENPRLQRELGNPAAPHRELCNLFNERGRCFRGARCPYIHACAQCGGQHAKRACPSTTHT